MFGNANCSCSSYCVLLTTGTPEQIVFQEWDDYVRRGTPTSILKCSVSARAPNLSRGTSISELLQGNSPSFPSLQQSLIPTMARLSSSEERVGAPQLCTLTAANWEVPVGSETCPLFISSVLKRPRSHTSSRPSGPVPKFPKDQSRCAHPRSAQRLISSAASNRICSTKS